MQNSKKGTGLLAVIGSILAGAVGVQSKENYERDFTQGDIKHFIIGGVIFTALFVVSVIGFVNWMIATA